MQICHKAAGSVSFLSIPELVMMLHHSNSPSVLCLLSHSCLHQSHTNTGGRRADDHSQRNTQKPDAGRRNLLFLRKTRHILTCMQHKQSACTSAQAAGVTCASAASLEDICSKRGERKRHILACSHRTTALLRHGCAPPHTRPF